MNTGKRLSFIFLTVLLSLCLVSCGADKAASQYDIRDYSVAAGERGLVRYENSGNGTDENSTFELGSNGKTVAAYTALAMCREGIKELLCHTAGFSPSYELGIDKKIYSDPVSMGTVLFDTFRHAPLQCVSSHTIQKARNTTTPNATAPFFSDAYILSVSGRTAKS